MQQHDNGQILYSPSDLVTFLGCRHASFLDAKTPNEDAGPAEDDSLSQLLQKRRLEHEAAYLQQMKDEGKAVDEIPEGHNLQDRAALTLESLKSSVDAVYRAVIFDAPWRVEADFLVKCDKPSGLGHFSYEALDAKLAQVATPKHIMQLCVCSDLLAKLQNLRPESMYLFLRNSEKQQFRVADFFYYYSHIKSRFEKWIENPPSESYPEPCRHCNSCRWQEECKARWDADNHLSLVANIRRSQMDKLRKAGIRTVADLAKASEETSIPDVNQDVFLRLRSQALLQHHKATTGENKYEIIKPSPDKGFYRMPKPDDGDIFLDIKGDTLYPNSLEYLFGVYYRRDGERAFKSLWAHDHEQEKEAFESFMVFLAGYLAQNPWVYIYHYSRYGTDALKRLACRYAVCEEQMDNLLRRQKFVDLRLVVRESIRVSEPGYSINDIETFYTDKRDDAAVSATDSIVHYNTWREVGSDDLLQQIADQNKMNCVSMHSLRDWLISIKPRKIPSFQDLSAGWLKRKISRKYREVQYEKYRDYLELSSENMLTVAERLSYLLEFHDREAKPQRWRMFERQNKFEEEIIEDAECIGGLRLIDVPELKNNPWICAYRFPPQEYKLKAGSEVFDVASMTPVGTIVDIDDDACIVIIGRGDSLPEKLSIGPPEPLNTKVIRSALYRYATHILWTTKSTHAATELLMRNIPRIRGKQAGEAIVTSDNLHADALEAIAAMNKSYIFIQGPPGAGKTYTSGYIIVDLLARGKRIGVTSTSHKAIHNLLKTIEKIAVERGVKFRGVKKGSDYNDESIYEGKFIHSEYIIGNESLRADLFAGTAWAITRSCFDGRFDYLFIDEAGQVSTANVVAMAVSSKNIVLVGDQMQLGQPTQGVHPGEAGLSVLEFLLQGRSTISDERGIFLGQTWRMRSSICNFISDAFYDGRLKARDANAKRSLNLQDTDLPNEGIVVLSVDHEGCSQKSVEEGKIIKAKYLELLGQSFAEQDGTSRPITEDDILVVAPYNVQVNYLCSILPEGARVGTIDKFQGQEAPIVLISMTTSSAGYLPRNIEFLYSRNRLNVALSRAQCLAIVVANPKLQEIPCNTVEQMKLVNTFCHLNEYSNSKKETA